MKMADCDNMENFVLIKIEAPDFDDSSSSFAVKKEDNCSSYSEEDNMKNILQSLRRFSTDSIKEEIKSESESNDYLEKFTSEVFLGYSSESNHSSEECILPERVHEVLQGDKNTNEKKTKCENNPEITSTASKSNDVITTKSTIEESNNKILECLLCQKQFSHMSTLKKHSLKHNSKFKVTCLICNNTISDPDQLNPHMSVHLKEKLLVCQSCGKTFRRVSNLLRHEPTCRKEKSQIEQLCTVCGKLCQSKWQLQQHMMFHSDERPFPCGYCSKSFRFKARLKEHERTHLGIKPHGCDQCRKSFTTSSDLRKHQKRHQNPAFKGYNTENNPNKLSVCKVCNSRVVNLKNHMHLHCEKGSGTCNICGKILKTKSLYQHIKIHLEGAHYKCEMCNRTFNRKDNMLSHRERHSKAGYKPKVSNNDES